jgi:hypothetical protein
LTPDAAATQQAMSNCNGTLTTGAAINPPSFLDQILCDTRVGGAASCVSGSYPLQTKIVMHRLPKLKSMPNVCKGVPANPWCGKRRA